MARPLALGAHSAAKRCLVHGIRTGIGVHLRDRASLLPFAPLVRRVVRCLAWTDARRKMCEPPDAALGSETRAQSQVRRYRRQQPIQPAVDPPAGPYTPRG